MRPYTEEPGAEQFARPVLDWRRVEQSARRPYGKKRPLGMPICLSYCLSFQATFGIPMVANWVDQKPQSTLRVLLYHVLLRLSSSTMVPMLLGWLAKLCDAFWSEANPAWSMRSRLHTLQAPGFTPFRNG